MSSKDKGKAKRGSKDHGRDSDKDRSTDKAKAVQTDKASTSRNTRTSNEVLSQGSTAGRQVVLGNHDGMIVHNDNPTTHVHIASITVNNVRAKDNFHPSMIETVQAVQESSRLKRVTTTLDANAELSGTLSDIAIRASDSSLNRIEPRPNSRGHPSIQREVDYRTCESTSEQVLPLTFNGKPRPQKEFRRIQESVGDVVGKITQEEQRSAQKRLTRSQSSHITDELNAISLSRDSSPVSDPLIHVNTNEPYVKRSSENLRLADAETSTTADSVVKSAWDDIGPKVAVVWTTGFEIMMHQNALSNRDTSAHHWVPWLSEASRERFDRIWNMQKYIYDLIKTLRKAANYEYELDLFLDMGENRRVCEEIPDDFLSDSPAISSLVYQLYCHELKTSSTGQQLVMQSSATSSVLSARLQDNNVARVRALPKPNLPDTFACSEALAYVQGSEYVHIHREKIGRQPLCAGSLSEKVASQQAYAHPVWMSGRHQVVKQMLQGLTVLYPLIATETGFLPPADIIIWKNGVPDQPWDLGSHWIDWAVNAIRLKVRNIDDKASYIPELEAPQQTMCRFRWYLGILIYGFGTGKVATMRKVSYDSVWESRNKVFDDIQYLNDKMGWEVGGLVQELLNHKNGDETLSLENVTNANMMALDMALATFLNLQLWVKAQTSDTRNLYSSTRIDKPHVGLPY